ncbi:hypothetical protein AYI69_g7905 [Smittium culicis]|uniref:Uncharacterized protein n=1 Tax=Smittium culicis TaxID=133412 RepID=A0A1R1XNM4_9FUNG|nr:hypothetical protein AYI69_g7905 [Smittium culicis]
MLADYFGISRLSNSEDFFISSHVPKNENNVDLFNYKSDDAVENIWNILNSSSDPGLKTRLPSDLQRSLQIKNSIYSRNLSVRNCIFGVEPNSFTAQSENNSYLSQSINHWPLFSGIIGTSICYFAAGCYYLVCALSSLNVFDGEVDIDVDYEYKGEFNLKNFTEILPVDKSLVESRRWFAKTASESPSSLLAWLAFGYTFYIVNDHERAIQSIRTALFISCPLEVFTENIISSLHPSRNSITGYIDSLPHYKIEDLKLGRDSIIPLSLLGSCYMNSNDLKNSNICFNKIISSQIGISIEQFYNEYLLKFFFNNDSKAFSNPSTFFDQDFFLLFDPLLFNEIGVSKFKSESYKESITWLSCALYFISVKPHLIGLTSTSFNNISGTSNKIVELKVTILLNLSNSYRKLELIKASLNFVQMALDLDPNNLDILLEKAFHYYLLSPPWSAETINSNLETESARILADKLFDEMQLDIDDISDENLYILNCVEMCHIVLASNPYNYLAAELVNMALDVVSLNKFSSISENDCVKSYIGNLDNETVSKINDLDEYLFGNLDISNFDLKNAAEFNGDYIDEPFESFMNSKNRKSSSTEKNNFDHLDMKKFIKTDCDNPSQEYYNNGKLKLSSEEIFIGNSNISPENFAIGHKISQDGFNEIGSTLENCAFTSVINGFAVDPKVDASDEEQDFSNGSDDYDDGSDMELD